MVFTSHLLHNSCMGIKTLGCIWFCGLACICVCVNRAHGNVLYLIFRNTVQQMGPLVQAADVAARDGRPSACVGSLQKMNLDLCIFHTALFAATSLRMHYAVPAACVRITSETRPYPTSYRPGFLCAQIQLVVTDEDASVSTVESV